MRPFPLVRVLLLRNRWLTFSFILLAAVAVAVGLAITTQERALRKCSARAAEPFDIIVAAPGSPRVSRDTREERDSDFAMCALSATS